MIAHVILFKPRTDLGAAERAAILRTMSAAATDIPGLNRFRIGRRVRHGLPGYEQVMQQDFEFVVIIEVDDIEALKGYLSHPAHAAFGQHFTQSAAAALAYDYELVESDQAGSLVAGEAGT